MGSRVRFKIGEIEFEAEGAADVIERERNAFMNVLLPVAIEAIIKTRSDKAITSYEDVSNSEEIKLIVKEDVISSNSSVSKLYEKPEFQYTNLASYLKDKGTLTEQDFSLFAAYFDEQKNGKAFFTKDDVDRYYSEARRTKPSNISMSLNRLAEKGYIMDADNVEQKMPKPYLISAEGIKYIQTFEPKTDVEKKHTKTKRTTTKTTSSYKSINVDDLNLNNYPAIKELKEFKAKMMMVLYIIINEGVGEWFTTADVMCLLTDIFGESCTKDQVNGVFNREKLWFKVEPVEGNKRDTRRKVLNAGLEYAKTLFNDVET